MTAEQRENSRRMHLRGIHNNNKVPGRKLEDGDLLVDMVLVHGNGTWLSNLRRTKWWPVDPDHLSPVMIFHKNREAT